MAATEMRIASDLGLPVTVVVFDDGSLNRIVEARIDPSQYEAQF